MLILCLLWLWFLASILQCFSHSPQHQCSELSTGNAILLSHFYYLLWTSVLGYFTVSPPQIQKFSSSPVPFELLYPFVNLSLSSPVFIFLSAPTVFLNFPLPALLPHFIQGFPLHNTTSSCSTSFYHSRSIHFGFCTHNIAIRQLFLPPVSSLLLLCLLIFSKHFATFIWLRQKKDVSRKLIKQIIPD